MTQEGAWEAILQLAVDGDSGPQWLKVLNKITNNSFHLSAFNGRYQLAPVVRAGKMS